MRLVPFITKVWFINILPLRIGYHMAWVTSIHLSSYDLTFSPMFTDGLGHSLISLVVAVMIMARNNTGDITTSFWDTVILTRNVDGDVSLGAKLSRLFLKNYLIENITTNCLGARTSSIQPRHSDGCWIRGSGWTEDIISRSKVQNTRLIYIVHRFGSPSIHALHIHFLPSVYTSVYLSLPSSAAPSLNFAPDETSPSMFLVNIIVSENDVVISPVLFLAIIMMATTSEIRVMPKAVYKA